MHVVPAFSLRGPWDWHEGDGRVNVIDGRVWEDWIESCAARVP